MQAANKLIPRSAFMILLVSYCAVMIPHYANVSAWLMVLSLAVSLWRVAVFRGVLSHPGSRFKTLLVITAVAGFYLTYRHQFSVETAVAFFVMAVSLKLIEVKFVKDCYLFVFVLLYLSACQFLFSQSFLTALYQMVSASLSLSVLFSLHKGSLNIPKRVRGGEFVKLMSITVPLVIVIFMFFPRIAPLWSIPLSTGKAYTGMTDSMSPGQIAELTQSSARAFRVEFNGDIPPQNQLYWRGLELDLLEGNTWRSSEFKARRFMGRLNEVRSYATNGQPSYNVLIEPTDKDWAYALVGSKIASNNIYVNERGYVRFNNNVIQPTRYSLTYGAVNAERSSGAGGLATGRALTSTELKRYLQLPKTGNPETRAFIEKLTQQGVRGSVLVEYLMTHFNQQPYYYTLRPPRTSDSFFDDFLFNTQRGFCAHFAGSMVYMLRLADIPSRVVVGYQGGEFNEHDVYLVVHQYYAHAWVEVWHTDDGWVRYDPTAMVAPDRIEKGLEEAVRNEGSFLADNTLAGARYNNIELVRWMRLRLDAINYNWQKWVVGYDGQTQYRLLGEWFGAVSFKTLAMIMAVMGGVIVTLAFLVLGYSKKRGPVDKVVLEFERFCRAVEKKGVKRATGETPVQFTNRLAVLFPDDQESLSYLARSFNLLQYSGLTNKQDREKLLRSMKLKGKAFSRSIKLRM